MHWYQIPAQISKLSQVTQGMGPLLLVSAWYFHEAHNQAQTWGTAWLKGCTPGLQGSLSSVQWPSTAGTFAPGVLRCCTSALCPGTNSATKAGLVHQLCLHTPHSALSGRHQVHPAFTQRENLRGIIPWSSTSEEPCLMQVSITQLQYAVFSNLG